MVAKIIEKINNKYLCGNCYITLKNIEPYCPFCGAIFSNYEHILIYKFKDEQSELRRLFLNDEINE